MTQLSDEVVERVARAIMAAFAKGSPSLTRTVNTEVWTCWEGEARAAIAAYEAKGDIPGLEG